jgi:hypothetical protein
MDKEDFATVADAGVLHPFVTIKELDKALGKTSTKSKDEFKVFVDLAAIGVKSRQIEFARKLKELVDEYQVKLSAPNHEDDLSSLLEEPVELKQAA